ncbi:MAG: hypothetical protein ACRC0X_02170 [Brevinema sp.]
MALIPSTLKAELLMIFQEMNTKNEQGNPMTAEQYADKLSIAITNYIKTGEVNTILTGTAGMNPISGTGIGLIK